MCVTCCKAAQIRLNILGERYREFSRAAGLRLQEDRLHVDGYRAGRKTTVYFAKGAGSPAEKAEAAQEPKRVLATEENIKAFSAAMEAAGYKVEGFSDHEIDVRSLTEMQKAYGKMAEIYPDVANGLKLVYDDDNPDYYGWYDPPTRAIHLNSKLYCDYAETEKIHAELVQSGYFPKGTDWRGSFYHEFGHAWGYYHGSRSYRKVIDSILYDMGYGHMNVYFTKKALKEELSMYSTTTTNPAFQETIAEVFSEWYNSNEPREFCKRFMKEVVVNA